MNRNSLGWWLTIGGIIAILFGCNVAMGQYQSSLNQFGRYFGGGSDFFSLLFSQPLSLIGFVALIAGMWMRYSAHATSNQYGECPTCKEQVRVGAEKCRFCGERLRWVEE